MTWFRNCVITTKTTRNAAPAEGNNRAVAAVSNATGATFRLKDARLYIPVVTLSAENDNKLLEQLKAGFKRTIKWNKYRSEVSNKAENNNSNYLIDPTFTKVNRRFVLSFENEEDRTYFGSYFIPTIEIKRLQCVN